MIQMRGVVLTFSLSIPLMMDYKNIGVNRVSADSFWDKAKNTLILSEILSSSSSSSSSSKSSSDSTMMDNPDFLPLCGNGKLDTSSEYGLYSRCLPLGLRSIFV